MDIADALALPDGSTVALTGFLMLVEGDRPLLCEMLLDSFPPQCGGARIEVEPAAAVGAAMPERSADAQWSSRPVTLHGRVRAGRLVVDAPR